jgi:MHS family proline/betaine transporter-like MFS transporter
VSSRRRRGKRSVAAGTLGAALEWYDFTLYVYLAPLIAQLFFPTGSTVDSLLATFGVFAGGYLMRPLGAALLGSYGDTHGRKAALLLSIGVMGAGMVVIGVLPTESAIGILAPIALIGVRLVQGFSLGGEFGGAITLLAENAPADRRGWIVNYAQVSAGAGTLLSAGVVALLHALLSNEQMLDFGWRLPFFLGGILGVIAILSLARAPESDLFAEEPDPERKVPVRELLGRERGMLVIGSLLNGYQSLSYYVVVTFVPTFLASFQGAPPEEATLAGVVAAATFAALSPAAGTLSDRLGRRPVMYGAALSMVALAVPMFLLLGLATLPAVIPAQAVLMGLVTAFSGASLVAVTEIFNTTTRYTGVSLSFNLGATLFGGTAPLLATALIKLTGYEGAPAILLAGAAAASLLVVFLTPETAPVRIGSGESEVGRRLIRATGT